MENADILVHYPAAISDALDILKARPETIIYGGGTRLGRAIVNGEVHGDAILNLQNISEMRRIHKNELRIDIGALASIKRMLSLGPSIIPPILYNALNTLMPSSSAAQASFGGNLAAYPEASTLMPLMGILDASIELRSASGIRWVKASNIITMNDDFIGPGEILTLIRIPLYPWSKTECCPLSSIGKFRNMQDVLFQLGKVDNSIIQKYRFACNLPGLGIIMSRELESALEGKRLPIDDKQLEQIFQLFEAPLGTELRTMILESINSFIKGLSIAD